MIDTIVFDIGGVLVDWHWEKSFTEWFGEDLIERLADATVRSKEWRELDRGVLSEEEVAALLVQNAPAYAKEITRVVHNSHEMITPFPFAREWVRSLKAAGYRVYILSNFSEFGFEASRPSFTFLQDADGALISYEVKLVKPDRAIYEALCARFSIVPENAVFLDDNPENIAGAESFGLHGILVESRAQADAALAALGVRTK